MARPTPICDGWVRPKGYPDYLPLSSLPYTWTHGAGREGLGPAGTEHPSIWELPKGAGDADTPSFTVHESLAFPKVVQS